MHVLSSRFRLLLTIFALMLSLGSALLPQASQASELSERAFLPMLRAGNAEPDVLPEPDLIEATETDGSAAAGDGYTLWSEDFEERTFAGRIAISGSAWATASSVVAHSGRYSAALLIMNATGSQKPEPGVRLAYNAREVTQPTAPDNLPDEAYYSAHYYFPQTVMGSWWNVMQWKQAVIVGSDEQTKVPVYSIHPLYWNNKMHFFLRSRVDSEGQYRDPAVIVAASPIPIPTREWVQLECLYRWSRLPDGRITCWQNGELLWDMNNIITEFDTPYLSYPRQWTVNNYAGQTWPTSHTLYVDDLALRTQPLDAP